MNTNLSEALPTFDQSPSTNRLELDQNNNIVVVTEHGEYTIPNSDLVGVSLENNNIHYYTDRSRVAHNGAETNQTIQRGFDSDNPNGELSYSAATTDAAFYATRLYPAPTR
jgi:hypothetical protein